MDLSFRAIGAEILALYWPVFAAGAAVEVWLVGRIRRSGRFRVAWIASISIAAAVLVAVLWGESFLAGQFAYQTVGTDARFDARREFEGHFMRTWPLLVPLAAVFVALVAHPRSDAAVATLVTAFGTLVSWIVAMWLFTTSHQPWLFQLLVGLSGLGLLASLIGFASATAVWMSIGRWLWKDGRRRRRAPVSVPRVSRPPRTRRS